MAGLAMVLVPGVASACWRDDSVWESRVADADLLGVMECVTAGVDVARYRLVEAWGGEVEVGQELTLGRGGLHLVGDRLLVVSSGGTEPGTFPDRSVDYQAWVSTSGARTPLGGRALRTDRLVHFGVVKLPLKNEAQPLRDLRSPHRSLAELEAAVRELVSLDEAERELRVLKALARRHLARDPLLERVLEAESVERLAQLVLQKRSSEGTILRVGGRAATLAVLDGMLGHDDVTSGIRARLGLTTQGRAPRSEPSAAEARAAAFQRLARLEATLDAESSVRPPASRGDPGRLAARIASRAWDDVDDPYWLASTFCLICPEDRVHHFRTLLGARDPWVRVTGAVYLALESESEGLRALEDLTRLEGDPGAWAALTLARRGVTAAVPRLLQVFGTNPDRSGAQAQLREQARALLSNAAVQAGAPQPPLFEGESEQAYRSWWARVGVQRLRDPWLDELRAQMID